MAAGLLYVFPKDGRPQLKQLSQNLSGFDDIKFEPSFTNFVTELSQRVSKYIRKLQIRTYHERNGVIYRGAPQYHGSVWRDWVMVDWGREGVIPNKIWGFVDMRALPERKKIRFGGLYYIDPGLYAIVESATFVDQGIEDKKSDIFVPIIKEVDEKESKYYLANVDSFHEPVIVIPDVGGPSNAYFIVKSRSSWREDFMTWLDMVHEPFPDFVDDDPNDQKNDDESIGEDRETSDEDGETSDEEPQYEEM